MSKADIGRLICTSIDNIHSSRELSTEQLEKAGDMAKLIKSCGRNWLVVYVKELEVYKYELIESLENLIILKATKMAGLKVIYCIQIDENLEVREQIMKGQELISSISAPISSNVPFSKEEKTNHFDLSSIFINIEDELHLKKKLGQVKGIGKKSIEKIFSKRPFASEEDLRNTIGERKVQLLKSKHSISFSNS